MDKKRISFVFIVILVSDCYGMTKPQLKNSLKLVKKTCLGKSGVEEDKIKNIESGTFIEEKEVMCYIACVYQMSQVVKSGKLNYEASMKQVDVMYPNEMKDAAKKAIDKCKDVSGKYKDLCEASFWSCKCIYEADPKNFIFA